MSYHIIINKSQNFTYGQLLENSYVPNDVAINGKAEADHIIVGYTKFYLLDESSRGVVLTVRDASYDIELNIGASTADYMLAAKLALALAQINNSKISPELDGDLSLSDFEARYDASWAKALRLNGVDTLKHHLQQNGEIKLPGCVRPFYFGNYVLNKISQDQPGEEEFADRIIDEIKKIQFIEKDVDGLEVPTLMDANFPEGVQTVQIVLACSRLLLQRSDWVILKEGGQMLKVKHQQFIHHLSSLLTRLDEAQYILQPIDQESYLDIMKHFSLTDHPSADLQPVEQKSSKPEVQTTVNGNKWWQFWKQ